MAAGGGVKQALFEQLARVGKGFAHPNRLSLLEFLAQGEKGVDGLASVSNMSVANTSQHLQHLRTAGLVTARKEGQRTIYRLTDDSIVDLMNILRVIAERNIAEVDQLISLYLKTKDDLEPVAGDELLRRVEEGLVTIIDVRPEDEYLAGHVAGAINIPKKQLEARLKELDPNKEVVAYCRGAYCLLSFDAVAELRRRGFAARRLVDGFPEWKQAGLPVDEGYHSD